MSELQQTNGHTTITHQEQVLNAHQFLKEFLARFDEAKRGGIHDFIEVTLFNMLTLALNNINTYLAPGHTDVSGNELMAIVVGAYQVVIENMKRNLDGIKEVRLK
jgi:hypothetical protein